MGRGAAGAALLPQFPPTKCHTRGLCDERLEKTEAQKSSPSAFSLSAPSHRGAGRQHRAQSTAALRRERSTAVRFCAGGAALHARDSAFVTVLRSAGGGREPQRSGGVTAAARKLWLLTRAARKRKLHLLERPDFADWLLVAQTGEDNVPPPTFTRCLLQRRAPRGARYCAVGYSVFFLLSSWLWPFPAGLPLPWLSFGRSLRRFLCPCPFLGSSLRCFPWLCLCLCLAGIGWEVALIFFLI